MTKLINRFNSDKLAETLNRLKSQIFVTQTNFSHIMRVTLTLVKSQVDLRSTSSQLR